MGRQALRTAEPIGFRTCAAQLKKRNNNDRKDLVGWWVLSPSETDPGRRAEFGFRVVRQFWGLGFTKEGTLVLLRYTFELIHSLRLRRGLSR